MWRKNWPALRWLGGWFGQCLSHARCSATLRSISSAPKRSRASTSAMMNIMAMWISNSTIMGGSRDALDQPLRGVVRAVLALKDLEVRDRPVPRLHGQGKPFLGSLYVSLVVVHTQMGLRHAQEEEQFSDGFHASM